MEWSKELTTHLIKLYREHRVLWDPTFMDSKNRNKRRDAWTELGAELKTNSSEVEKRMRMLIGQFQRELKKGRSGDGADAPYKTKWNFFKMLLFLKDKNKPRHSTEGGLTPEQDTQDTSDNKTAEKEGKTTGGGPPKRAKISENEESLINDNIQFVPMPNPYDSAAQFFDEDIPTTSAAGIINSTYYEETNELDDEEDVTIRNNDFHKNNKMNKAITKENFLEEYNSIKLEIVKQELKKVQIEKEIKLQELKNKRKEFEERMKYLRLENEIKVQELKVITIKAEAEKLALKKLLS